MILYDVITVGSNTIDVFVKTDVELIHNKCKGKSKTKKKSDDVFMVYPVGEKILINHLDFQVGGGGTNTAVAFSRLGLKTAYLGKIGKDENGVKVFRLLKKEKIDFIGTLGKTTGFSVVLDSIKDDRTILTHKGCNDEFSFHELDLDHLQTKWFYFSSMMGKSLIALRHIAKFVKDEDIKLAFNPSSYLVKKGMKELKKILSACNILILNKEESMVLSGKKGINEILKELKKHVKDYVVVTDGKKGAWCYDGETKFSSQPKKNLKIVETTGAGDAFASGFVASIIRKKDVKSALKAGFIEAESVIQAYGAKNDLQSYKKMNEKLKKDKRIIKARKL